MRTFFYPAYFRRTDSGGAYSVDFSDLPAACLRGPPWKKLSPWRARPFLSTSME